ncbi:MAG: anti-sigma-factor antagonist [Solirubrobacterales bacterium]|nr:anti-sigma-factor antagonist [Solirubrobacterales bacterium]
MVIWEAWRGKHSIRGGAPRLLRAPFEVEDLASGNDHTLVLSGELDIAAAEDLEAAVIPCADAAALTLDLSRLSFMDSTGLTVVLLADALCKARGIAFALVPGPRQVQRVFEIAGLLEKLPFEMDPAN